MDTRSTTTTAAAAAAAATAASPSPAPATGDASLVVRIKKEPTSSSDEMKEFAETAMNELLGWYGYDGGGEDEDGADESDAQLRTRSIGDSSGPECSDSGGGGGGGGGGGSSGPGGPWCGWCSRPMTDGAQATGAFCSELCFSQSRRASFKRNRTCDWCRHVRHTVAHVDVRDGARHLQFCGDKCLNQYKMHIFCRETRAHLELHPHPHPAGHPSASGILGDAALITPDLWLRDCKDESSSDRQASSMSPRQPQPASHESNTGVPPRKRHCTANRRSLGSVNRRTRTSTVTSYHEPTAEVPQDLRVRPRSPTEAAAANESAAPKTPSVEQPRHWPLAPPPVTVLVPYPVIIPVPVPLPLPIPIPVPEELLKRAATNSSSTTTTTSTASSTTTTPIVTSKTTTTTTTTTTTKVETPEKQTDVQSAPVELTTTPSVRTLRKRKRPVGKEGSGRDQQTTRRTVPA